MVLCSVQHGTPSGDTGDSFMNADLVQVQLSLQASSFFFKCCAEEGLLHLKLIKYVQTCWSSMYNLLK